MPHRNGSAAGSLRAILYARVSTDEQARSGFSLAQQLDALRAYAAREGFEVLEEVQDPGQSGASLERPGMDRVRDLVAGGGTAVVLAQDRDRFAREPAYLYLLREEFAEHGTKLRALNDRGDESPEGQLTDGILDQLAKFERAKIAERSRRGKLQKARQGKIVAGPRPNYGFQYNDTRDNYVVDEETMWIIRRIFRMIGVEGQSMRAVRMAFDREEIKPPRGGRWWSPKYIRDVIREDAYRPHSFEEIEQFVTPEVAARLDPHNEYGIWWFNRRRQEFKQVSEIGPNGRKYRRRVKMTDKPRSEWVAVPVPNSGIPREWIDAAREAIKDNMAPSANDDRVWELSGRILQCQECGNSMVTHTTVGHWNGKEYRYHYYRCPNHRNRGFEACSHNKCWTAAKLEERVWEFVAGLLQDPERLRVGLEELIDQERAGSRGDPEKEIAHWLQKSAEVDRKRSGFQDMAAEGLITLDELRAKLAGLEEIANTAEEEIACLRGRLNRVEELEQNRDTLLVEYAGLIPEALGDLDAEQRQQIYRMMRLHIAVDPAGDMEITGAIGSEAGKNLCHSGTTQPFTISSRFVVSEKQKHA
ncbi:MAG: recombinase family protein [Rubrobacteraceae bacterium]